MSEVFRCFMGAGGPGGFVSLFDRLGDRAEGWRGIVIKGGPGTGKSTLMRRVEDALSPDCGEIEEVHCSSDERCLDALIFPEKKLWIADGTPPHTIEPAYPGAYEQSFSLCECWKPALLRARRDEIFALFDAAADCHREAMSYIGGAAALLGEVRRMAAAYTDEDKISRLARSLAQRELHLPHGNGREGSRGKERVRILSAATDRGRVLYGERLELPRLYVIEDRWGFASPLLMAALRELALSAGLDVVTCVCPLAPLTRIDHLLIPSRGVGFAVRSAFHPVEAPACRIMHAERFTDKAGLSAHRGRIKFLQRAAENLMDQACAQMAQAKLLHDRLESIYVSAMDYDAVDALSRRVVAFALQIQ